jgi:micrococcal nuclease
MKHLILALFVLLPTELVAYEPDDLGKIKGGQCPGCNLWGVNLKDAELPSANLRGANLKDSDLRDATLTNADLRGADLRGADLRGTNFFGADLSGANLKWSHILGTKFNGAILCNTTMHEGQVEFGGCDVPLIKRLIAVPVPVSEFTGVEYVRNYDGDTVTVNIPGVHPLLGNEIGIRVRGIDTPEIRGGCVFEKRKAKEAQTMVQDVLNHAKDITLRDIERGKYFRIVATVVVDGRNLGDLLIDQKLAIPYDGGRKVKWCDLEGKLR